MILENIEKIIEELENEEVTWRYHAQDEVIVGNVVKENCYRGTAAGIRIAINIIREHQESRGE